MRCMPWPTHGSGCGEEREAPEYLELARGGRGRGAGARRRRGAATTRASDRAGAAVLPPPDGGARRVRAHLLCDHRHRRTCRGTVPTVLPDRHRTPQPPALRAVSPRQDRKSTRLNSSHSQISYAVFCLKKKKTITKPHGAPARLLSRHVPQVRPCVRRRVGNGVHTPSLYTHTSSAIAQLTPAPPQLYQL